MTGIKRDRKQGAGGGGHHVLLFIKEACVDNIREIIHFYTVQV